MLGEVNHAILITDWTVHYADPRLTATLIEDLGHNWVMCLAKTHGMVQPLKEREREREEFWLRPPKNNATICNLCVAPLQ